jgi:inhibitor of KinA
MQIEHAGEESVVLSVSYEQTRDSVQAVQLIQNFIDTHPHPAIQSIRRGLDCILLEHSNNRSFDDWLDELQRTDLQISLTETPNASLFVIPVCYDFGYDLPAISDQTGLSASDIIEAHSSGTYSVWMIGFMPGFPYMGEVPQKLQLQRKSAPDPHVPSGSVAIAEEYVGIYPFDSPGGWHVIGRTPLKIVDYSRHIPWIFDYGMQVRFEPISADEFERIERST